MKSDPRLRELEDDMRNAAHYAEWREAAQAHDRLSGAWEWMREAETSLYDWQLLRSRTQLLRRLKREQDIPRLVFYLHEELHGNLGNMANPELYNRARSGTKRLITDYLDEVVTTLEELSETGEPALPRARKLRFFREAAHSFGRSGLLLSGGATLGLFHLGVIKALWSEGLLPTVLSGASAGSIVAAVAATHDDNELTGIFDPGYIRMEAWRDFGLNSLFEGRGLGADRLGPKSAGHFSSIDQNCKVTTGTLTTAGEKMEKEPELITMKVVFHYFAATNAGENRHAQLVMMELAEKHGFKILRGEAFSIGDCWVFDIDAPEGIEFPSYIEIVPPERIGVIDVHEIE